MGPGRPAIVAPTHGSGGLLGQVSDYPVQIEKVQTPPLRDETLARDRLLDWLHVKIHRRAVLVLAEAGYGKTTLMADFTRRTRVRVSWFRLDRGDRDWLGFIAHLVVAFRIHQPDFAPTTQSMIREASAAAPSRDSVLNTFIRELGTLPVEPAALVLDDFHLVDDSQDARTIVRELLARAPERLSFVLISRTTPSLPLARLRALGEVAELGTSDLRFAPDETERLFRETYALNLEPSIVAELSRRTEGWVASLQLVRAAIRDRDRSEIRAFVRSLNGAEGNLYDYLAEEVVGELSGEQQQFLMRTSLLEVIEPVLGGVAGAIPPEQTRASIADGEQLGLFSRIGPNTRDHVRAHPLVRDFLQARLRRSIGPDAVIGIHRAVAAAAEVINWRIAGHHYLEAGDLDDARRVLASAIDTILATGAYSAAEELVNGLPATEHPDPNVLVVLSRLAQQRGQSSLGRDLAEAAFAERSDSGAVGVTLVSARLLAGDIEGATTVASDLAVRAELAEASAIGQAIRLALETSLGGNLVAAKHAIEQTVERLRQRGGLHYLGVGLSNLGYVLKAQGEAHAALEAADDAVAALEATSAGGELVSARLLQAWALAHLGDLDQGRASIRVARGLARGDQLVEVAYEGAEVEAFYGDPEAALMLLLEVGGKFDGETDAGEQAILPQIHADVALGRIDEASRGAAQLKCGLMRSAVAFESRRRLAIALVSAIRAEPQAKEQARTGWEWAEQQGAHLWARVLRVVAAANEGEGFCAVVHEEAIRDTATLSMCADIIASRLDHLDQPTRNQVSEEARLRPERWRGPLRQAVENLRGQPQAAAASLLDEVGAEPDISLLRRHARASKVGPYPRAAGRRLARRLAPRVFVDDLGRVELLIGDLKVDGSSIRRKVLALLCLLLTKRQFSATREEVLDALWPDLDPSTALNSLNQTVYFLRRVFEPAFAEDTSPGYVGQDGETVWLDHELVQSRSRRCRNLIRVMPTVPDPESVLELANEYHGRFALDFLYEEWAGTYRDSLHAAFLTNVEGALRGDINSGHYVRGVRLAQIAMEADPGAEEIQVALTRLYRLSGSLAAAAEQYESYARAQRELGLEPEPLDRL